VMALPIYFDKVISIDGYTDSGGRYYRIIMYRWPKQFGTFFVLLITLSNINEFSNVFHYQYQEIPPHLKCVATLPCEMTMS